MRRAKPAWTIACRPFPRPTRFQTVHANDPIWTDDAARARWEIDAGTFVRLYPPAELPDVVREAVSARCRGAAVRWMPASRAASGEALRFEIDEAATPRQVIAQMVAEIPSSDREALSKLCDTIMSEAGI